MSFQEVAKAQEKAFKDHVAAEGFFVGTKMVEAYTVDNELNLVGVLYKDDAGFDNLTMSQWEAMKSLQPYPETQISIRRYGGLIADIKEALIKAKDTDAASRTVLDLLMAERCTISAAEWVFQQIDNDVKVALRGVSKKMSEGLDAVIVRTFDARAVQDIYVQQIHEFLLETDPKKESPNPEPVNEETLSVGAEEAAAPAPSEETVVVEAPAEAVAEAAPVEEAPATEAAPAVEEAVA
jgi:hypothetical protein